jgi:hypothetical protein
MTKDTKKKEGKERNNIENIKSMAYWEQSRLWKALEINILKLQGRTTNQLSFFG